HDLDLLANGVHQGKGDRGEHDRQGNPRKAAPTAHIQDPGTLVKDLDLGDSQGMQYMAQVEFVYVLAGHHIDLFVPILVEVPQGAVPVLLEVCQVRKVSENKIGI